MRSCEKRGSKSSTATPHSLRAGADEALARAPLRLEPPREAVEVRIVRDHGAHLAGLDVVRDVEGEDSCVPLRAGPMALVGRAMGLGCVID
jgi:hypothetical protein